MASEVFRCLLISDFNLDNMAGYLANDPEWPNIEVRKTPIGQVIPSLVDETRECWQEDIDFAVVWTRPEAVIPSFDALLKYEKVDGDSIGGEVDDFVDALSALQGRVKFVFVPSWSLSAHHRGLGMLDMQVGVGLNSTLMDMNLRLANGLGNIDSSYFVLNAQKWIESVGKKAFSPRLWYMAKIPFSNEVFKESVRDIKVSVSGIQGRAKKLLVVDLDDTLWGGIVGDVGWENLRLGGHDPLGEALVDFQKELKALTNRGIMLGIASKNEESVALEAIASHPEMVLKSGDFVGWKINWEDKAKNILELVTELNIGIDSVVFIDDSPAERARVREAFPEVLVPEWPQDKMLYKQALLDLRCFDVPSLAEEDGKRTQMYASERERKKLKEDIGSLEDWLEKLEVKVQVEEFNSANLQRTVQLLNKTNQMNLRTRRMTENELVDWVREGLCLFWTFRVKDRFGAYGLTGIISLEVRGREAIICDFLLSCRVMGRKVEEAMVYTAIEAARSRGLDRVCAHYISTVKNRPCLKFWEESGFSREGDSDSFIWDLQSVYPAPDLVELSIT
jgi:FkbH-like protein